MQNFFGKTLGVRAKALGLIGIGAVLLALFAYLRQPASDAPLPDGSSAARELATRFGPGTWIEPTAATTAAAEGVPDTAPPGGLATTADRHLIANKALHDVIDYFLLGGHPGERPAHVAKLQAHLKASLPSPAYEESVRIVQNYLTYLDAHDQLLARESMPAPTPESSTAPMDLDRITAWVAQRARLRQSLLGIKVAETWFAEEEAETQRTLSALRKRGAGPPQALTVDTDPLQLGTSSLLAMRAKGASPDTQRQHIASQFGEAAAQRFDALEREEQAWQARYANYRHAADQITQQPGIAAADRTRQIDALLAQTFASEPERIRARALGAQ